jgi:hypothetical protein
MKASAVKGKQATKEKTRDGARREGRHREEQHQIEAKRTCTATTCSDRDWHRALDSAQSLKIKLKIK